MRSSGWCVIPCKRFPDLIDIHCKGSQRQWQRQTQVQIKYPGLKNFTSVTRSTVYASWDLTHMSWDLTHVSWDLTHTIWDLTHMSSDLTHMSWDLTHVSWDLTHVSWDLTHTRSDWTKHWKLRNIQKSSILSFLMFDLISHGLNLIWHKIIIWHCMEKKSQQECVPVGCVPAARRLYGGVCFGGVCLVPGGCLPGPGGVSTWSRGVSAWSWGVYLVLGGGLPDRGGVCLVPGGACIPACTEADTPPVDRHTPVKTLPWPQLRCSR